MDRKRTQRILGILVIIALVIILFPLLFGKNEAPTQITNVAPPPFPDQQQSSTPAVANSSNDDTTHSATNSVTNDQAAPNTESSAATQSSSQPSEGDSSTASHSATPAPISDTQEQMSTDISPAIALEINNRTTPDVQSLRTAMPDDAISIDSEKIKSESESEPVIPVVNQKAIKTISLTKAKKEVTSKVNSSLTSLTPSREKLVKLNSKAWAVQMGSFKSKENARVLADRLRASGFKAFTKEVKSQKGSVQTRVYIGPEFKQASAIQLNADVQQTLNMQGIVIAYKPLAL